MFLLVFTTYKTYKPDINSFVKIYVYVIFIVYCLFSFLYFLSFLFLFFPYYEQASVDKSNSQGDKRNTVEWCCFRQALLNKCLKFAKIEQGRPDNLP